MYVVKRVYTLRLSPDVPPFSFSGNLGMHEAFSGKRKSSYQFHLLQAEKVEREARVL